MVINSEHFIDLFVRVQDSEIGYSSCGRLDECGVRTVDFLSFYLYMCMTGGMHVHYMHAVAHRDQKSYVQLQCPMWLP